MGAVRRPWWATRPGNLLTPAKYSLDMTREVGDGPIFAVGFPPYISILRARPELFMLEIKVQGFSTTDSLGRKAYKKAFLIKWEVDIGALTVDLLMNVLAKEVQWSSRQCGRLWFFDKNLGEDV